MSEELKVVLRRSEHSGFGFSLLGTTGPPHVIFDIVENSPAADCGEVEAGDVILKVNGTDVHRYTTKEVLKCLRLSDDLVTLELKRDPKLKARIKEQLAKTKSPHYVDIESHNIYDYSATPKTTSPTRTTTAIRQQHSKQHQQQQQQYVGYETTTIARSASIATTNSPAQRYKSPTHLPSLRQSSSSNIVPPSAGSSNHSRNSSASSAKIQIVETSSTTTTTRTEYTALTAAGATSPTAATSPTSFRPSRIPQALKSAQKPPPPVQHSPQNKRPRPSQIPTKAGIGNGSATTASTEGGIQHSNSYSSSCTRNFQQQQQQLRECEREHEPEPNSAPPQPAKAPRFEAYMMTGDLILNLSRTPQSSNILTTHAKKVDSLRDSPCRSVIAANARANGALAPRASGESSPSSSSSVDSPTNTASSDSVKQGKSKRDRQMQPHSLQQQQRDSINNTYNRKDSLTNDTLLLCEDIERDEDVDDIEAETGTQSYEVSNNRQRKQQRHLKAQQQQRYRRQQQSYEYYQNDEELEENEEDQTHYGITNIETYNSGGSGAGVGISQSVDDDDSDRQCLVIRDDDEDDNNGEDEDGDDNNDEAGEYIVVENEEYSTNSVASPSMKQRLRALKQKSVSARQRNRDAVDSVQGQQRLHQHYSASSNSSATVKSEGIGGANTSQDETSFSVPTSPISLSTPLIEKETANSVPTSPEPSSFGAVGAAGPSAQDSSSAVAAGVVRRHNGHVVRKCDAAGFRTSKSEDHLQQVQREGIAAVIPIDIDEDVNSSLNTLLDTRHDSEDSQASNRDRIVWTYNAPLKPHELQQLQQQQQQQQQKQQYASAHFAAGGGGGGSVSGGGRQSNTNSHSSSLSSSPQHSAGSPASPTSVSSSVMSSSGSKGALGMSGTQQQQQQQQTNGQTLQSQQQQQHTRNSNNQNQMNDAGGMILSDPSDSDSTILVSDTAALQRQQLKQQLKAQQQQQQQQQQTEHKLVIQVRGLDSNNTSPRSAYSELKDSEDELATLTGEPPTTIMNAAGTAAAGDARDSSPPVSDDGSDVESLHSYHYSPKAVDLPSAIRLAKRLYSLDGFKKSDVSRHLSKNNDFSRAVADEYLKHFNFEKKSLDQSLREFLQQFSLSGETQERERVLVHFSKRYLDCNPGAFNSQDAVHTLTCAIMLLNTDLHGQNIGRKMSCAGFVENLAELNDGDNFPKDVLKLLYQAIKSKPLEWALDDDAAESQKRGENNAGGANAGAVGQNPFLDMPESSTAVEYKKGYVMRKCCYDTNYKKTPFGKRSWKMFYCTLRDLVLYLHKDEHGFRKSQMSDNLHNAIRIHHALAAKAADYTKKQHVFRLQTADQAEYLFQTSDSKELTSWVETINFVCAAYSAPPLEGGVGSQKRFQRPLLPSTHTRLLMKEQLDSHEQQLAQLEHELNEHKKGPVPSKGLPLQNYKEKENYLQYEIRRYRSYASILSAKLLADQQQLELQQQQQLLQATDEEADTFPVSGGVMRLQQQQQPQQQQQLQTNSITVQQQQQQLQNQSSNRKKDKKK